MTREDCQCPVCGRSGPLKPRYYPGDTRGVTWSDECCCTDNTTCVAHQCGKEPFPTRPSQETMEQRAFAHYEKALKRWEERKARVEETIELFKYGTPKELIKIIEDYFDITGIWTTDK